MPEVFKYAYRVQKLNLAAGLTDFEIPLHGEKVTYASPTDGPEISIRLQSKSNDQIPLRPQGEITAPFTRLFVSADVYAGSVNILISGPKDVQLTGRDVSIYGNVGIRSLRQRALENGTLFRRHAGRQAAAGQYVALQCKNPAASGKTVTVLGAWVHTEITNGLIYFGRIDTNLSTLVGSFFNQSLGSPDSTAELRSQVGPTPSGLLVGMNNHHVGVTPPAVNSSIHVPLMMRLSEGQGLCLELLPVAATLYASFELIEE